MAVFSENCAQIRDFPTSSIRTHKSGVVNEAEGGTVGEERISSQDLLR